MTHEYPQPFARNYESLLKRLKLCGMRPKTIESYIAPFHSGMIKHG